MKIIHLWSICALFMLIDARFSLYHTDDPQGSSSIFDCLYAHIMDDVPDDDTLQTKSYHLTPYCRRPGENEKPDKFLRRSNENVSNDITFSQLYRQGVTSTQLLSWLAPIDIAERYEKDAENSTEVFYNCSSPWFGPICQYTFDNDVLSSFGDTVQVIFASLLILTAEEFLTAGTCYPFLATCDRGMSSLCLDWREVCDGILDCLNGEDEQLCQLLEITECPENEFRCHYGGQCIPFSFLRDGMTDLDCLDGADESVAISSYGPLAYRCFSVTTFRCEEHTRRYPLSFSCGDGQSHRGLIPSWSGNCYNARDKKMSSAVLTSLDHILDSSCQQAFFCSLRIDHVLFGTQTKNNKHCEPLADRCSSQWLVLPEHPIIFGFFQFVYLTNRSVDEFKTNLMPDFICFNSTHCPALLFCVTDIEMRNGLSCCRTASLSNDTLVDWYFVGDILRNAFERCLKIGTDETCSHPSLFHCARSSKCVSKHRLVDGCSDCYFGEDESFPACQLNDSTRFICQSEPNKCLSMAAVENTQNDCLAGEDELNEHQRNVLRGYVPFELLCDGQRDFMSLENSNETDETHCESWPCNNPYVRCDNVWQCLNGDDELNCPGKICSLNEHHCKFGSETGFVCVPWFDLMESYSECNASYLDRYIHLNNKSVDNTTYYLRWDETKCITADHICRTRPLLPVLSDDVCLMETSLPLITDRSFILEVSEDNFCHFAKSQTDIKKSNPFLITSRLSYFPEISLVPSVGERIHSDRSQAVNRQMKTRESWYCNRGVLIFLQVNKTKACLCPPSYLGDRCQWQNQRISLTLQLVYRSPRYTMSVLQLIIMITDEQGRVAPYHEQVTYVPKRECDTKFNLYLLYPDQPKNASSNYSIRIDLFDKRILRYWGSWHLPIPFQFLPVNRIATQLFIPANDQSESCSLFCGAHGKCVRYINKNLSYFCRCDHGYAGLHCDIEHVCSCSLGSFCLASSICVCPMNRFGSKCYLKHSICQPSTNPCENNGLCVPVDDRIALNSFTCLCTEEFYGARCENTKNRINIEFDAEIRISVSAVFVHYITAFELMKHQRITTLKKILFRQNNISLFVTQQFHILLVEIPRQNYYLAVLRERFIESEFIQTKVSSSQKCFHIDEISNATFRQYPFLRRVKYYPLFCRQNKRLVCFYDEIHMCICDLDRFSNCFTFDRSTIYNCQSYSDCQNGGQCFQDNATCPSVSICVCPDCFYGTKCQFSTEGFVLSLDNILGYHIKPKVSLFQQPSLIKVSVSLTTFIFIFGLVNGILSLLTFGIKKTRDLGCGFYLLVASWASLFTVIVLEIKFWQLLLSQMAILTNRSILTWNCIVLDMILRVLLTLSDWLYGCVAVERLITVAKGAHFDISMSKRMAKWVTLCLLIWIILTHLHDPVHRRLIDDIDVDEQRIWCFVQYSSSTKTFHSFITLFNFVIPFVINLGSAILIIVSIARSRSMLQTRLSFHEHLRLQVKKHKSQLIAPCALVLLALPRLILSFTSRCMKSPNSAGLFLLTYLMSFLPSMMTFIVFVLPSKLFKDEFDTIIQRTIRLLRRTTS